ncbi:MAG: hypothetical protein ACLSG8_08005 [Barnesiella sp.]
MDTHSELKALSKFLGEYATCLMAAGHIRHALPVIHRHCRIIHPDAHMTLFVKTVIMTLCDKITRMYIVQ